MQFVPVNNNHLQIIRHIATTTWAETYNRILSPEQSLYMLEMMYSDESLLQQINSNQQFVLIHNDESNDYEAFASFEFNYQGSDKTKIHKLYALPRSHGKGLGRSLVEHITSLAIERKNSAITLNMNRFNESYGFYIKMGFSITGEEDIDIGNGYLMEDYIFEKKI